MMRLPAMLSVFFLIACGGSDTSQAGDTGTAGSAPPVSAAAVPGAPESSPAAVDPQVTTCLDLRRQAKLDAALPVCLAALEADPENAEVQAAVEMARAATARVAADAAAAQATAAAVAATADAAAGGAASRTEAVAAGVVGEPGP